MNKMRKNERWKRPVILAAILSVGIGVGMWLAGCRGEPEKPGKEQQEKVILYTCPMHPQVIQDEPGQCPICGMNLAPAESGSGGEGKSSDKAEGERRVLYWVAPMDPTYISDRPGKSPMGMDLVPVHEGEEPGAGGVVKIDPALVQTMGVRTHEVTVGPLVRTTRSVGTFEASEDSLKIVNSKIEGWIERLYADRTGQAVKRGEPLLSIYSPSLVSTQEEYLASLRHYNAVKDSPYPDIVESARALLEASEKRLLYWDISAAQVRKLKRTGKVEKTLTLFSPAAGVILHKNAVQGMKVMPGQDLFRIADLTTLWLKLKFYEQDTAWVQEGDRAEIEVDYLPGEGFEGELEYVYPYMENRTRVLTARIVVENADLKLKPGMFATVTVMHQASEKAVLIPDEAVIRSGERKLVFIDLGGGRFSPREVSIGLLGEGRMVEVKSGLRPGERIVTSAQFMLDSESTLQEAIRKILESKETERADTHETGETLHDHQGRDMQDMEESKPTSGHDHGSMEMEDIDSSSQAYYTCPMEEDQEVVSEQPGKCPKCGMKLVPVDDVKYDHPLKHKTGE